METYVTVPPDGTYSIIIGMDFNVFFSIHLEIAETLDYLVFAQSHFGLVSSLLRNHCKSVWAKKFNNLPFWKINLNDSREGILGAKKA